MGKVPDEFQSGGFKSNFLKLPPEFIYIIAFIIVEKQELILTYF